jgi:hypothetical protein
VLCELRRARFIMLVREPAVERQVGDTPVTVV